MSMDIDTPRAGPSSAALNGEGTTTRALAPGPTPYHETSQFRHWRYSPTHLQTLRQQLNEKSKQVVKENTKLEKEAQISLGHEYSEPPPANTYLSVEDELLLLRFYIVQAGTICRNGFGLPEVVESTANSYLKRFYLKNSVMDWHPKQIMPTCLFLAAKTTNYPVPIDVFIKKISKLQASDILDTEFLLAQSLAFEFWIRGAEKALRGWALDLQELPELDTSELQKALPIALDYLSKSRQTDLEFIYTPSQIGLACLHLANPSMVETFLDWRYSTNPTTNGGIDIDVDMDSKDSDPNAGGTLLMYGIEKDRLLDIIREIGSVIEDVQEIQLKAVKEVDKRLKGCSNPEKIPGTALYIKRKQEQEASSAAIQAQKAQKVAKEVADRDALFGDVIIPTNTSGVKRQPLSPRTTVPVGTMSPGGGGRVTAPSPLRKQGGSGTGENDGSMEPHGMGVRDEGMGMVVGGKGLKEVGKQLEEED